MINNVSEVAPLIMDQSRPWGCQIADNFFFRTQTRSTLNHIGFFLDLSYLIKSVASQPAVVIWLCVSKSEIRKNMRTQILKMILIIML